ncbi:MAG: anhydro-N-acetylmuramic acid kinase [Burkholderiaceae bacterium]|nr:anhydro-N-acetylmuramic acid kinase [Burkholderiaceae bacterium]
MSDLDLYIGLMSGTSMDGVDGVLFDFSPTTPTVVQYACAPFSTDLRVELLALNAAGENELHRAALAANALVRVYAQVVEQLMAQAKLAPADIRAIGAHGQTVRHRPGEFDATGYTLQLNNPALLAELTGIDVVADFRSRDVAAGGQGAPLVPAFHQEVFAGPDEVVAVLNIGGISNLSVLQTPIVGFDCGPGNALMDYWCQQHTGQMFDHDGRWAASGQVSEPLLQVLLAEPFLSKAPPKSTGRDLFNGPWLRHHLQPFPHVLPVDVQATLTEFTARACAMSLSSYANKSKKLIVCGGGALNGHLMRRLQAALPAVAVASSADYGLPPLQVEAAAFAWLARKTIRRETASLKSVTGARGSRILGAIYPA